MALNKPSRPEDEFTSIIVIPTIEWTPPEYREFAKKRMVAILDKIIGGRMPSGFINVFSELPSDVMNPLLCDLKGWEAHYNRAFEALRQKHPRYFRNYTLILEIVATDEVRGFLRFTFSPEKPDTNQRVFEP